MSNQEKIIDRVRKMLAIANDGRAPDAERDNALRMAHALLAKHNLAMSEVESREEQEDRITEQFLHKSFPWARIVAHAVGQLFFCEFFYQHTFDAGKSYYNFIGRESNTATARAMTEYLTASIEKEARKAAKDALQGLGGKYHRDFCKGASAAIWRRVVEIRTAAENSQQTSDSRALTIVSLYAQEAAENAVILATFDAKERPDRQSAADAAAWRKGHAHGNSVSLNLQVGGASKANDLLK